MDNSSVELDFFDSYAKRELTKAQYETWENLFESNSHLEKARDWILVLQLIDLLEEITFLKKKLKSKRGEENNTRIHENSNGTVQTHPYKTQLKDTQTELRRVISDLALSPTSAASLNSLNDKDIEVLKKVFEKPARVGNNRAED